MSAFPEIARYNERDLLALSILRSKGASASQARQTVDAQIDIREAAKLNLRKRVYILKAQGYVKTQPRNQHRVCGSTSIARQTGRGQAPNRRMAGAELVIRRIAA